MKPDSEDTPQAMAPDEIGSWGNCLAVLACALAGATVGGVAMFPGLDLVTGLISPQSRQGQYGLHFLYTIPAGVIGGGLMGGAVCYCLQARVGHPGYVWAALASGIGALFVYGLWMAGLL